MSTAIHVILDSSAMVAAGRGNALASRLIHRAHAESGWLLHATTCALIEADRERKGTAEHIAALPGLTFLELDLPAALVVAHGHDDWAVAHTLYAAQPSSDRPEGAVIATTAPSLWQPHPVRTLDLNP
ncbi:hypothetical protein CFP59_09278 [Streptomyces malaysiensis subsp. malaysiensis]|uniref:hypothetical protein n=1 Tax=Streptomyces malaysiensis TaxID=92644 RepID=UPI000CA3CCCC|nr:hypothetical protein [Streptomyces sp. M56]AUA17085.1 hypothetical protein CFP59_09278 [Streptomyces sp. M56]